MKRLLALTLLAAAGCGDGKPAEVKKPWRQPPPGPAVGQSAPYIDLYDELQKRHTSRDWLGKPAVLVFGTTMCPRCKAQVADVEKLKKRWEGRLSVAAVLLSETEERAAAYAKEHALTFPMLLDKQNSTMLPYKLGDYPHYVLIDARGVIRSTGPAMPGDKEIGEALEVAQ